jgi:hypothetical protein
MISLLDSLLGMKHESTTTSRKQRASMEWHHSSSLKPKNVQTQPSAGKVMLTLFWDQKGVILEHYTPRGNTVTSASYTDLLKNHLRPAINTKRHGLLSIGVILHHDNARPHIAYATAASIEYLHFECLPHPPYSPDCAPSDYYIFGPLKEALGERSSNRMKRYTKQCMTGCTVNQKNFFSHKNSGTL